MALDIRTCAGIVSEYTLSQDASGHLAKDPASRFRAEAWNDRTLPNHDIPHLHNRQSGDSSKVKGLRLKFNKTLGAR